MKGTSRPSQLRHGRRPFRVSHPLRFPGMTRPLRSPGILRGCLPQPQGNRRRRESVHGCCCCVLLPSLRRRLSLLPGPPGKSVDNSVYTRLLNWAVPNAPEENSGSYGDCASTFPPSPYGLRLVIIAMLADLATLPTGDNEAHAQSSAVPAAPCGPDRRGGLPRWRGARLGRSGRRLHSGRTPPRQGRQHPYGSIAPRGRHLAGEA